MSIWGKILGEGGTQILKPISDIINNVTTNKEEKIKAETALKEVLLQFELAVEQEWTKREAAILADVASARDMQKAALAQDDKFSKRFVYYFITAWSIFSMAYLALVTFIEIPKDSVRHADTILGFLLGTAIASIIAYMVGSTRGSEHKNETIKNLSKSQNGT